MKTKKIMEDYIIVWNCGHKWNGRNTHLTPNNEEKAKKCGCPYCGEKKVREILYSHRSRKLK